VLHTAFGIAERKAPEVAFVNYGINMDVGKVGADVLTPDKIDRVVQDHPRLGFQEKFLDLVVDHANAGPIAISSGPGGWQWGTPRTPARLTNMGALEGFESRPSAATNSPRQRRRSAAEQPALTGPALTPP